MPPNQATAAAQTWANLRRSAGWRATVALMETESFTAYVTARGPEGIDNEGVSNLLAESDLGGVVKSHSFASSAVTLVVEVCSPSREAAYELVIGRMGVALGPDWTVEADVDGDAT
jgi:putative heme iron utilization protein